MKWHQGHKPTQLLQDSIVRGRTWVCHLSHLVEDVLKVIFFGQLVSLFFTVGHIAQYLETIMSIDRVFGLRKKLEDSVVKQVVHNILAPVDLISGQQRHIEDCELLVVLERRVKESNNLSNKLLAGVRVQSLGVEFLSLLQPFFKFRFFFLERCRVYIWRHCYWPMLLLKLFNLLLQLLFLFFYLLGAILSLQRIFLRLLLAHALLRLFLFHF